MKKVAVIGAGFAGLSAASFLARDGYDVTIYEKNSSPGGRARQFKANGFTFDMGPSWYWMPDVFEHFFKSFNKRPEDYYDLQRLDPSYRVIFGSSSDDIWDIPASYTRLRSLFESVEHGAGERLDKFLKEAEYKYDAGINDLVYRPSHSMLEFANWKVVSGLARMHLMRSFSKHVRRYFKHPRIIQLLEFPVLFLGAKPSKIPALYSLMNFADIKLGTWYPKGGMHKIVEGMTSVAREQGVQFRLNSSIEKIQPAANGVETTLLVDGMEEVVDIIVAGADYQHVETQLLDDKFKSYNNNYWSSRTLAPSALIYYLGIDRKVANLEHHNLFFDTDFEQHAEDIYDHARWPEAPLFYTCCPSKSDDTVAPEGKENLFILIPIAPGLKTDNHHREKYFRYVIDRLEKHCGHSIEKEISYHRNYSVEDFTKDYNAYKGNAYGLANTLKQTAWMKPKLKSKKVKNLYYTGQLTVPGPGVPPSLISGEVVAREVLKDYPNHIQ